MAKNKLSILYISQYFHPEVGASQTRSLEMAGNLVKLGHKVTVLTEFPNHPSGIIPDEYKGKWFEYDHMNGIDIVRTWVFARPDKNFYTRMGFYLSYMLFAALFGSFMGGKFDIIYVTSPPFFVGVTGLWLSRLKSAKFIFEIRDLWPQGAVELGEVSNKRFIRWAEKLEKVYYQKADKIIVVTKGVETTLKERGITAEKIHYIPNGTNTDLFRDFGKRSKELYGRDDKFIVLYAGNLGIAQGVESMCELVERFKNVKDVQFIFIGDGPLKNQIKEKKSAVSLDNLILMDQVPREKIAHYIAAADCCLVPLKKIPLFKRTVPSKVFDYMACQRPVIVGVDGEAHRIVTESGGGIYVEPENVDQMQQAILRLKASPKICREMGRAGRTYVAKNFSRRQGALDLEKIFLNIATHKTNV
ncbi:glycosyltransferase family 4 protein [candidate division KSB1 bacterium]|nr:glycosyltransferase family 4 protein [candidate division KSB1 bacterium]